MSNLRWIERDGKMVLQENPHPNFTDWSDVPTHQEPNKYMNVNGCSGTYRVEPKHTGDGPCPACVEPKKVDMLVEELANGFRNYADIGKNYEWSLADYAVKFFKARMPKESTMDCTANYNRAIRTVRQALFGEA